MKIAISPNHPTINRHVRAFLNRRLDSAMGFIMMARFLTAASSAGAEQPEFIRSLSAISPVATSSQAQGPLRVSSDPSQAGMNQIISELNQRQFQLSVAGAQTAAQRPVFVPQTFTTRRAK